MKKNFLIIIALFAVSAIFAQQATELRGSVKNENSKQPIPGVTITLLNQNLSTKTNMKGEFSLTYVKEGTEDISISKNGYFPKIRTIKIEKSMKNDLGEIFLQVDIQEEARQDAVLQLNESDFSEDDGRASQSISSALSGDAYVSQTSYAFSPMRFKSRGYDNEFESTYINGVHFNTLDRGGFNYSSLGGLNQINRNKDEVYGVSTNSFSYGGLGRSTNILNKASMHSAGHKGSVAYSNRAYKLRGQYTYATGVMPNGWALATSAVVRWSDEGMVQGTFYNSAGLFLAAEKIFNDKHSLSLVAYAAPTRRAQQSAATQETYDLAGTINYNSYWGYYDGKKRNSRVVESFDPTAIINHEFKISQTQKLRTGLGMHYSKYSNSALSFYNAPDPRPDYYRYLPSFQANPEMRNTIAQMWQDPKVAQINWDNLYLANYRNNEINPNGSSKYILERRHNDLAEIAFNSTYTNRVNQIYKLTAGVEAKYGKKLSYKTVDDLLGGNQWIDIDQFAERDFPSNPDIIQNDMNNPNRVVKKGDRFGYDYDINVLHTSLFLQNEWQLDHLELYLAGKLTYSNFQRVGHMRNGRAPENSYGKGNLWWFLDPSVKAGITYKKDGRSRFYANILAESKAPVPNNSFVSQRVKASIVKNLQSRKILSYDVNYAFNFPNVRGRVSAFQTHMFNTTENLGYYDDIEHTFINHLLSKSDKVYRGLEFGITGKINNSFSVSVSQTFADYRYTSNSVGIKSFENGSKPDITENILTKDLMINAGPQIAMNATLNYFHPKMWFADITVNYFDKNYLDFAPNRFTESNVALYTTPEMKAALGTQEKLKGGFMVDMSVGKVIYLPNRKSININLSLNNILNNTKMVTGGYQQARLPYTAGELDTTNLSKFPNKYYYAWGFNMFLNLGFRF